MRFGTVHRVLTTAIVALGIFAVLSAGVLSSMAAVISVLGLLVGILLPESIQNKPWVAKIFPIGLLLLFFLLPVRIALGGPPLELAIEGITYAQVLRIATRRGAAQDPLLFAFALVHFVSGTVFGGGLGYAACFVGFLVLAPGALVLSHLRREVEGNYRQGARDRTGLPVDVPRILRSRRVVGKGFLFATCALALPMLVVTAGIFLIFPRVGLSLFFISQPRGARMVGFSDHVDLGQVGMLRSDASLALRFRADGDNNPQRFVLRLRGAALDLYDGRAWSRSSIERRGLVEKQETRGSSVFTLRRHPQAGDTKVSFELEPIDPPVVFFPTTTIALLASPNVPPPASDGISLRRGLEGEIRYDGNNDPRGFSYDAYLSKGNEVYLEPMTSIDRARYLATPPSTTRRVHELALEWTKGITDPMLKAKAIEERLKTTYQYDLGSPSAGTQQPVDHFLFDSRRGHCEFFSTTMAMLLRENGIPSRNVTGFVGGTYNRFGRYYAVRRGDAHSWVEAFMEDPARPGQGSWQTFDPTPTAGAQPTDDSQSSYGYVRDFMDAMSQRWQRNVLGYDLATQVRAVKWMSKTGKGMSTNGSPRRKAALGIFLIAGVAVSAYLLTRKKRVRAKEKKAKEDGPQAQTPAQVDASELFRALEGELRVQGFQRPAHVTPLRFAETIEHPKRTDIVELTEIYLEARYGDRTVSKEDYLSKVSGIKTAGEAGR